MRGGIVSTLGQVSGFDLLQGIYLNGKNLPSEERSLDTYLMIFCFRIDSILSPFSFSSFLLIFILAQSFKVNFHLFL
jgi:hypothetical protein